MAVTNPSIGKLREVVKFEQNNPSDLGAGQKDNFTELLTTRGKLRKESGSRGLDVGAILLTSDYTLYVRYQQVLADNLNDFENMRIVCENRFFTIDSFTIVNERFNFYYFKLKEASI